MAVASTAAVPMSSSGQALTVVASPHFPVAQVPKVAASSSEAFQAFIDTASPVVFSRDIADTSRLLTPDDLREAFGREHVTVSISHGGTFRPQTGTVIPAKRMIFADFANYAARSDFPNSERLYLSQFSLDERLVGPGSQVATPPNVESISGSIDKNLWFGPAGTVSPLHFDRSHNLLHQHFGYKHLVIFDPAYSNAMSPGPKNSGTPHVSSLDLVTSSGCVDVSSLAVPCFETILAPGDVLFIPALWWHNVVSLSVSISVNYWWRAPLGACLHPNFFRMMSSAVVYTRPSIITRWADVAPHGVDTALCLHFIEEGHTFAAAALAGAIVTAFCDKALRMLGMPEAQRQEGDVQSGSVPSFAQAATLIPAMAAQGLINSAQSDLLSRTLKLAEETAMDSEPLEYSPERSTAIRHLLSRLHCELGQWLSM